MLFCTVYNSVYYTPDEFNYRNMPFKNALSITRSKKLETLVENRTHYTLSNAELNVYETHQEAEQVLLRFSQPVLASMIMGKKVMHLGENSSFDFFPGESVILPSNELMCIDFPEARLENPTKCLALTLSEDFINQVCHDLEEGMPRMDDANWYFTKENFHFTNDIAIHQIINRLIYVFAENHPSKDLFANMMLKELIIRIMQTDIRYNIDKGVEESTASRLSYVLNYIKKNLSEPLTVKTLSQKSYMSESHFYRSFKNEMGTSPVEYILQERISKATRLLRCTDRSVKDIAMECGFNNLSYFNRLFKRRFRKTPTIYREQDSGVTA